MQCQFMINNVFCYYFHVVTLNIDVIYFSVFLISFTYGLYLFPLFSFLSCLLGFSLVNTK
jgi:membrane protein implicated in regulation of membrane protease activity